jgi:hypothetical protein
MIKGCVWGLHAKERAESSPNKPQQCTHLFCPTNFLRRARGKAKETTDPRLSTCYRVKSKRDRVARALETGAGKDSVPIDPEKMKELKSEYLHLDKTLQDMIIPNYKP